MKKNDYSPQIRESWLRSSYIGNSDYKKALLCYMNNSIEESIGELAARRKICEVIAAFIDELQSSFPYASETPEKIQKIQQNILCLLTGLSTPIRNQKHQL